ncbi:MAG: hypothetical protein U0790_04985 [Isosphaeraceae bacterium]
MTGPASEAVAPVRALSLCGIALSGVFAAAGLGAVTNAVNARISPDYFITILGWRGVQDVWRASIAQGLFEGLCFGLFFSLVFTAGVGIITRAACTYGFAARHLLGIVAAALVCWVIGGIAAMGLATLSPDFYQRAFRGVPEEFGPMLRYAWVGGSIWGLELGGLLSTVLGLVILRANWLRLHPGKGSRSGE